MEVELTTDDERTIRSHGEAAYPHECCGFLLGGVRDGRKVVTRVVPAENAREDGARRNRFLITPDDYRRMDRVARADKLDIVGFYHSHPDRPARPSEFDREHAWPWYSYVIVAVAKKRAEAMTSWVLDDDRTTFSEEGIARADGNPSA